MNTQLTLSVSPHIHSGRTTRRIMLDVLIALLPAAVAGVVLNAILPGNDYEFGVNPSGDQNRGIHR